MKFILSCKKTKLTFVLLCCFSLPKIGNFFFFFLTNMGFNEATHLLWHSLKNSDGYRAQVVDFPTPPSSPAPCLQGDCSVTHLLVLDLLGKKSQRLSPPGFNKQPVYAASDWSVTLAAALLLWQLRVDLGWTPTLLLLLFPSSAALVEKIRCKSSQVKTETGRWFLG